jgi:ubiquitin C-terminal hydrolase
VCSSDLDRFRFGHPIYAEYGQGRTSPHAAPAVKKATWKEPRAVSLENMGNMCYLNAALQCLAHTRALVDFFLQPDWVTQLSSRKNKPRSTGGAVAHSFAKLLGQIWTGGKTPIRLSDVRDALGQFAKQFVTLDQQDTMEAAQYIFDGVHEDFNIPERSTNTEPVFGNGRDDLKTSARSWQRHTTRNRSLIVQLFHGLLRSHMQCLACNDVAVVFDSFVILSLPVGQAHRTSMVVTFVPLRFEEPRQILDLQISSNAPPKDFARQLGILSATVSTSSVSCAFRAELAAVRFATCDLKADNSSNSVRL